MYSGSADNRPPNQSETQNRMKKQKNIYIQFVWLMVQVSLIMILPLSTLAQIAHVGSSIKSTGASSTFTINRPAGTATGNVLIAVIASNNNSNNPISIIDQPTTGPIGWNEISQAYATAGLFGDNESRFVVFYKIVYDISEEPTSYGFTMDEHTSGSVGSISAYEGVTWDGGVNEFGVPFSGPFENNPGQLSISSGSSISLTGVTTNSDGVGVVMIALSGGTNSYSSWTLGSPPNNAMTELIDRNTSNGASNSIGQAFKLQASNGFTGGANVLLNASDVHKAGLLLTLKPCNSPVINSISFLETEICDTNIATLVIEGNLNDATEWDIYHVACDGTFIGSTSSDTFSFQAPLAGNYYVVASGDCGVTPVCLSTLLEFTAPPCASNPTPIDASIDNSIAPLFSWLGGCESGYLFNLGTDNPPSNILQSVEILGDTFYDLSMLLLPNTTYYWQVIPFNNTDSAEDCPVWSFSTNDGTPSCSSPITPINESIVFDLSTDIVWSQSPEANDYILYFGTDNPPTNLVNGISQGNVTSYNFPIDLQNGLTYYWRVIPTNSYGVGEECETFEFNTVSEECEEFIDPLYCLTCSCPVEAIENPQLSTSCDAMKIMLILDESGSMSAHQGYVENAITGLVRELVCSGAEIAIVEFSNYARIVLPDYYEITTEIAEAVEDYFNMVSNPILHQNASYSPNWNTNYFSGFLAADSFSIKPDLILFVSDGLPTHTYINQEPEYWDPNPTECGTGSLQNSIIQANKFKCLGSRIFCIGVGNFPNINETLSYLSGPTVGSSIIENDYLIEEPLDLALALREAIYSTCSIPGKVTYTHPCIPGNGIIKIRTNSEFLPFDYEIYYNASLYLSDENVFEEEVLIENLESGNYTVILNVTSPNSCTNEKVISFTLTFEPFPHGFETVNVNCDDPYSGGLYLSSGIMPPFTLLMEGPISIDTPGLTINTNNYFIDSLVIGDYTYSIENSNGCILENEFSIIQESTCCPDCPPADVTISCDESTSTNNPELGEPENTQNCGFIAIDQSITGNNCLRIIERAWLTIFPIFDTLCVQTITVVDTTGPIINCPNDLNLICGILNNQTLVTNWLNSIAATDDCNGGSQIEFTHNYDGILPTQACMGTSSKTVVFTAEDGCGNISTCARQITITDNSPPIVKCPDPITIECHESTDPINLGNPIVTEACSQITDTTFSDALVDGSLPCYARFERTWFSTNVCGLTGSCVQEFEVNDNTDPVLVCPPSVTIQCYESSDINETGIASATDNCDATPVIAHTNVTVQDPMFNGTVIERIWLATDDCGNSEACSQFIYIADLDAPPISIPEYDTICSGEVLEFSLESQNSLIEYSWSFGSGSTPSTAEDTGPHTVTYTDTPINTTSASTVVVNMQAPGCFTVNDTVAFIHVNSLPVVDIVLHPGDTCIFDPRTISSGEPLQSNFAYAWDFGDGAIPLASNAFGPHTIEYSTSGLKSVQLIIETNEAGATCIDCSTTEFFTGICPGVASGSVNLVSGTGIPGVQILLFKDENRDSIPDSSTPTNTAFTSASGNYTFVNLSPGYYIIQETTPSELTYVNVSDDDITPDQDSITNFDPADDLIPVTIESSEFDNGNNFIEALLPCQISGLVFDDLNNDGSPAGEEMMEGVIVELYPDLNADGMPDSGAPLQTDTTNHLGFYIFGDLDVGQYAVTEIAPSGYINVSDIDVTNDGDVLPNSNQTNDIIPVTLFAAEHDRDNWFIEQLTCRKLVTTLPDGMYGSLRYNINCIDSGDTIKFHPSLFGQTINIDQDRLIISKDLMISSVFTPKLIISFNVNGGFLITSGHQVELKNLSIFSGLNGYPGNAIENEGYLILDEIDIFPHTLLNPIENLLYLKPGSTLEVRGASMIREE